MWSPTHIQVTIHSARGVLIKGKSGSNNCFVTIGLGKEKFQTSVQKNAGPNVEWREECELRIPDRGNRAELVLTCLHKGSVVDDFLGMVTLPLNEMDVYERPRQRWHRLEAKPGHEKKDKHRGELEVRIAFTVNQETGSTADLRAKSGSKTGSLLSLTGSDGKRRTMKSFAKSLGSRLNLNNKPPKNGLEHQPDADSVSSGSVVSVNQRQPAAAQRDPVSQPKSGQLGRPKPPPPLSRQLPNADPGVNSDEEVDEDDFVFDNMSHKSSGSSLNVGRSQQQLSGALPPPSPLARHSSGGRNDATVVDNSTLAQRSQTLPPPSKPPRASEPAPSPQLLPLAPSSARPPPPPSSVVVHDEWDAKLQGSSDSLKRRSWDTSRVVIPISVTPPPSSNASNAATSNGASTAPTTPNLERIAEPAAAEKPKPLPRSATLESIEEREAANASPSVAVKEKDSGKDSKHRMLNKFKYFRKDRESAGSAEDLKKMASTAEAKQMQLNERIIIGHENEMQRRNGNGVAAAGLGAEVGRRVVSAELQQKYEGKTREDMLVLANDLENEVKLQKLKMKEMEDYLDDLLLRVMETHPKILQNPYRNQTSAKSG